MPVQINKQSRFQGGTRPWNVPQDRGRTDGKVKLTTHDSRDKIDACLSCTLPDCDPDTADCRITRSRKVRKPPEDFLRWAHGPMTNREWAEELGVSVRTISYWREKYHLSRD